MPDGRYMQTAWESGSRAVAGFVDVTTGASYPLLEYDGASRPSLWPSPDGRIVAIAPRSNEGLQLWATDGSWKRTVTMLAGNYTLTWSPESALLAIVRDVPPYNSFGLDVVRPDGTSVYHADAFSSYPPSVTWTRCEAE
jgi:hypothetical protein